MCGVCGRSDQPVQLSLRRKTYLTTMRLLLVSANRPSPAPLGRPPGRAEVDDEPGVFPPQLENLRLQDKSVLLMVCPDMAVQEGGDMVSVTDNQT